MTKTHSPMRTLLRWDLLGFAFCVVLFLVFPQLDLAVAANYYDGSGFTYADNRFVRFIYVLFAKIHVAFLLLFIVAIVFCSRKHWLEARRKWVFLLICLVLGPGLLINVIIKDNSLGRPRPEHVQQFGGEATFTPAFFYSGACAKNCSFVSGHAAMGFYLMAVAWVRQRRIWLMYGLILGALVGFVRILQGGHFLSDVIFAGWFTYFCYLGIARVMGMSLPPGTSTEAADGDEERQK